MSVSGNNPSYSALPPEAATVLARETRYLWGEALFAAECFLTTRETPRQSFVATVDRAPSNPRDGYALVNRTVPFAKARELGRQGCRTHITVEPSPTPRVTARLNRQLAGSHGSFVIGYPA